MSRTEVNVAPCETAEVVPTRILLAFNTETLRLELRHMCFVNHLGLLNVVDGLVVAPVEMAPIDSEGVMSRQYHKKGPTRRTL